MKDLLAKLEEAECGSDALDDEIAELRGWKLVGIAPKLWRNPEDRYVGIERPQFTRSVDAALSIVPAGWVYSIADRGSQGGLAILASDILGRGISAKAKTIELAICSAALRARALMGGGK